MSIGHAIGIVAAIFVFVAFFSNGLMMLVSPALWFKLPSYVAFRGSLQERDYMKKLSGQLQIRALGLALVCFPVYVVSRLFGVNSELVGAIGSKADAVILRYGRWLCVMTSVAVMGCGIIMLLKPKSWTMKYMSAGEANESRQALLARIVRIMSLPTLAVGAYFLAQCVAAR